jgi:hypothetical protein
MEPPFEWPFIDSECQKDERCSQECQDRRRFWKERHQDGQQRVAGQGQPENQSAKASAAGRGACDRDPLHSLTDRVPPTLG